eukprot:PITA_04447
MVDCKPITTSMELDFKKISGSAAGPVLRNATEYRQLVGELMFLVNSRPDICFAVNTLSQHMVEPHHIHWIGAKNLLRYLRDTITYGLRYTARDVKLLGYTDADWAGNVVDRKSTFGCCFSLGSASISWMSRKQKSVALSIAEAEYIATSMASCEAVWLQKLFNELFGFTLDTTVILCDNQSGIRLSENLVFHDRSKHIDISGRSCTPYDTDFESVEDWSRTNGTHFETDSEAVEDGTIHPRSFLPLHNSDKAEQSKSAQSRANQNRAEQAE